LLFWPLVRAVVSSATTVLHVIVYDDNDPAGPSRSQSSRMRLSFRSTVRTAQFIIVSEAISSFV
jgi:hypothetical protein